MNNKKPIKGQQLSALKKGTKPKLGILPVEFDLYDVEPVVEAVIEKKVEPKKKVSAKKSKAKKSEVKKDGSIKETI